MPVSTTDTVSGPYLADGSVTSFPFTFRAVTADEVSVIIRDGNGIDAVISRDDFTVTLTSTGGTVDFYSPPTGGQVYVHSDPDFLQSIAFSSGQKFLPEVVNEANDRSAVRDLVLRDGLSRALQAPVGEIGLELPSVQLRAGKALLFDGDGALALADTAPAIGEGYLEWPFLNLPVAQSEFDCEGSSGKDVQVLVNGVVLQTEDYTHVGDLVTLADEALETFDVLVRTMGGFALRLQAYAQSTSYSALIVAEAGTVAAKLRQTINPLDKPFAASGNGIIDDTASVSLAGSSGPLTITGNHRITANLTIFRPVTFHGEGRFTIDAGVTVTFSGGLTAPCKQIFYGQGAVAGLSETWLEWFCGDARAQYPAIPSVECSAARQKAANATLGGGVIRARAGAYLCDGSSALNLSGGQSFEGASEAVNGTVFYWPGTARNGFTKIDSGLGIRGGSIRNVRFDPVDNSVVPTAGRAIYVNQSDVTVDRIEHTGAYEGIVFDTVVKGRSLNCRSNDCLKTPLRISNGLDVFVRDWNASALGDLVSLTGIPIGGAFVVGEAVNCATGSNGTILTVYSPTKYRIQWVGIRPPVAGTITATGKSGTVASVVVGHQTGQMRFEGTCESCVISTGDGVGGEYGLLISGSGAAGRVANNSGYNIIHADAHFDTTYQGSTNDGGYGWVDNGWYSTSRNKNSFGLAYVKCRRIYGSPRCTNNAGAGLQWDDTCEDLYLSPIMDGNCRNYDLAAMADILVLGAAKKYHIRGGTAGKTGLSGFTPPKAMIIAAAAGDDFSVIGLDCPAGSITNGATGSNQTWFGVPGMPNRAPISSWANAANDAAAAAAGVPIGGEYRNGSIKMVRVV